MAGRLRRGVSGRRWKRWWRWRSKRRRKTTLTATWRERELRGRERKNGTQLGRGAQTDDYGKVTEKEKSVEVTELWRRVKQERKME